MQVHPLKISLIISEITDEIRKAEKLHLGMETAESGTLFASAQNKLIQLGTELERLGLLGGIKDIEELCEILYQEAISEDSAEFKRLVDQRIVLSDRIELNLKYGILRVGLYVDQVPAVKNVLAQCDQAENETGDYYQLTVYPRFGNTRNDEAYDVDDVAIVLQGQILYDNNFTLDTIHYYRYLYPKVPIILSTWAGEVTEEFRLHMDELNVCVIENTYPENSGRSNINYQLCNTHAGVKEALRYEDVTYCLKTRTDQRIYKKDFLTFFKNQLQIYPVRPNDVLKNRILILGGTSSNLLLPFHLCDFLVFGNKEDIETYYRSPFPAGELDYAYQNNDEWIGTKIKMIPYENLQYVRKHKEEIKRKWSSVMFKYYDPEIYISRTFYERALLGRKIEADEDLYDHFWGYLRDYIVACDPTDLLLYWPKYKYKSYQRNYLTNDGGLCFSAWQDIFIHGV